MSSNIEDKIKVLAKKEARDRGYRMGIWLFFASGLLGSMALVTVIKAPNSQTNVMLWAPIAAVGDAGLVLCLFNHRRNKISDYDDSKLAVYNAYVAVKDAYTLDIGVSDRRDAKS